MIKINTTRKFRDVNELTEYEKAIYELRKQGLKWREIAERLGQKMESVRSRYPTIKDKLGELDDASE